jgi:transposase
MSTEQDNLFHDPSLQPKKGKRPKARSPQVFRPSHQHQEMVFPPNLDDLIPLDHLVRVVDQTIEALDLSALIASYKGSGASAYHPKMLLKVLIYAYLSKIYSSRQIAKALRQDIHFLWLAGMQQPAFSILNKFRSGRLKPVINEVFGSMVLFLLDRGYVDLQEYFVDGTKLRADANKHKVVWAKNTRRYKEQVQQKIAARLAEIERANAAEQAYYGERDLAEQGEASTLTSEAVQEEVARLNRIIANTPDDKQAAATVKEIATKHLPALRKYEQQEKTLGDRNSYARTDPDATVFRTKDQQLVPAYNVVIGTQNQFILNYNFHQKKASESDAFPAHMQRFFDLLNRYPRRIMGDSAFGSEENYAFLAGQEIGNFLKYNTFHKEQTTAHREDPFRKEHFPYDPQTDTYTCPDGRRLEFIEVRDVKTTNNYPTRVRHYRSADCSGCSLAALCKRGKGPRSIQVNPVLESFRAQARANLQSAEGIALRKRRGIDVEPPFGDIKHNQRYTRFQLRGEEKVNVEFGILSIGHNIKKMKGKSIN